MKISFYQQPAGETEKQHADASGVRGKGHGERCGPKVSDSSKGTGAVGGFYAPGGERGSIQGKVSRKGKSLIELQQEAQSADVGISQDYMTLMSHTLSEEDYRKAREEGFDFGSMNPEETVTIVDRIKAELVRAGKNVAGYTDDIDMEKLAAALGSQGLAQAAAKSFAENDIPLTEENLEQTAAAWRMAQQLQTLDQGSLRYLIDNEMDSGIWNLYVAESSGAAEGGSGRPGYFAQEVQGYYAVNAAPPVRGSAGAEAGIRGNADANTVGGEFARQIDGVIVASGRQIDEESRGDAVWLLEKGLPLTGENLERLAEFKALELPVSEERFAETAACAIAEGKAPVYGPLSDRTENIYERAARTEAYYQSPEMWESCAGDIAARRLLEEIRLRMTAEVNVKLLKSGFSIDTAPMEKLVEALRQAEAELAEQYFPQDADCVEKYRNFRETNQALRELPALPADVLGSLVQERGSSAEGTGASAREQESSAEGMRAFARERGSSAEAVETFTRVRGAEGTAESRPENLSDFHKAGKALRDTYRKAGESYEALMTQPRKDLGDGIRKAFANVDDILEDLGQEPTEENRRAVRILGYNRMEMSLENLTKVREADRVVRTVVEKLTPAAALKMIRDGINPLEKSFAELEAYFGELPEDYRQESESYSRFLYGLERSHAVTDEERESYIGIYRLMRQIEKTDGAAVGALVNIQADLHFSNLLSAVRSGKFKSLDAKIGDRTDAVVKRVQKGESISAQIARAFVSDVDKIMTEVSYDEELERDYNHQQLEQYRAAVKTADEACTAMLQRGDIPPGADNLLAAAALLGETSDLFSDGDEDGQEQEIWELLDSPEEFDKEYDRNVVKTLDRVEAVTFQSADTSLDVRRMQLVHKQLTIAGAMAGRREFFLPLRTGDKTMRVHLTFERAEGSAGTVEISVKSGESTGLKAAFRFEGAVLNGVIRANAGSSQENKNGVMEIGRIADIFKEEAGENWKIGSVSVVSTDVGLSAAAGAGMEAGTENVELYRVAKVFLRAVQSERITNPQNQEREGTAYAN